jgi:hypothetical protein
LAFPGPIRSPAEYASVLDGGQRIGRIRFVIERMPGVWLWNVHRPPERRTAAHGLIYGSRHGQGRIQGGLGSTESRHHARAAGSGLLRAMNRDGGWSAACCNRSEHQFGIVRASRKVGVLVHRGSIPAQPRTRRRRVLPSQERNAPPQPLRARRLRPFLSAAAHQAKKESPSEALLELKVFGGRFLSRLSHTRR